MTAKTKKILYWVVAVLVILAAAGTTAYKVVTGEDVEDGIPVEDSTIVVTDTVVPVDTLVVDTIAE